MSRRSSRAAHLVLLNSLLLIIAMLLMSCAARSGPPPSLGPQGAAAWRAQRAVLAFESLQVGVIGLNKIQRCSVQPPEGPPRPTACVPLLSTDITRAVLKVIDATVVTLGESPNGWHATTSSGLSQVRQLLGMQGQSQATGWLMLIEAILKEPPI